MDSKKRTLFTLTFVLGLLGVGMLVASLATDYWLESRPVRNVDDDTLAVAINVTGGDLDTKFTGYIHFGLFHGSKSLDYGFGPRHSEISGEYQTCECYICMQFRNISVCTLSPIQFC